MLFNSISFAIFLPIVFAIYWIIPHRFRNGFLLICSYYFYMSWNPNLVFLILGTTVVSFFTARYIHLLKSSGGKRFLLFVGVGTSLATLFYFKYFNFFLASVVDILSLFSLNLDAFTLNLILPVGISFYTFQTLSYVIDVYKGKMECEKNFFTYALYVSFFPQLVAGPIERPEKLIPQFKLRHTFNYDNAVYGAKKIVLGMFKKVAVADTFAVYVDNTFNNLPEPEGFALIFATVLFTFQIYCDFSGYSDIALGTAKLLGFDLMQNFKCPYFSKGIREFWQRWHISLSSWFKDYVYIPLGGNRKGFAKQCLFVLITFLVSGLWHGASINFVLWGLFHGFLNICDMLLSKTRLISKTPNIIKQVITLTMVGYGWIIFRVSTLDGFLHINKSMFNGISTGLSYFTSAFDYMGISYVTLLGMAVLVIALICLDYLDYKGDAIITISSLKLLPRWTIYFAGIYVTMFLFFIQINVGAPQAFVYFQF